MFQVSASFLAAAVMQVATPPPAPVIVEPIFYFDPGSSEYLPQNDRNYEVLLGHARRPNVTAIVISAHTDTVGSEADNMALSHRRGLNLADALIARGVPSSLIRIEALGETRPARPTADGVDEPLNRFVWVDIRVQD